MSHLLLNFSLQGEDGSKPAKKQGLTKHDRTLKCTYCTIDVKFAGTTVRQFFSKRERNGQWNAHYRPFAQSPLSILDVRYPLDY